MLLCLLLAGLFGLACQWNPVFVNHTCPRYLFGDTDAGGLGDQLQHYFHFLWMARRLNAALVLATTAFQHSVHHPSLAKLYTFNSDIAAFLGVEAIYADKKLLLQQHSGSSLVQINVHYDDLLGAEIPHPAGCHVLYATDISCRTRAWCPSMPGYSVLNDNFFVLKQRSQHYRRECSAKFGDTPDEAAARVVVHLRIGDIALHQNEDYYRNLQRLFGETLAFRAGCDMRFISEKSPPQVVRDMFPNATFFEGGIEALFEACCLMLGADVLVTSGSSLSSSLANFAPTSMVVLEEVRKEVTRFAAQHPKMPPADYAKNVHMYDTDDHLNTVFHLRDGVPLAPGFADDVHRALRIHKAARC